MCLGGVGRGYTESESGGTSEAKPSVLVEQVHLPCYRCSAGKCGNLSLFSSGRKAAVVHFVLWALKDEHSVEVFPVSY